MKTYEVHYMLHSADITKEIEVQAANKAEAYDKAVFDEIPKKHDGEQAWGAYVASVRYASGRVQRFNTGYGLPY